MQLATHEPEEIKLNMTAMIDIVFQLLVFFIMTFKVVEMEGDFNIRMPLASLAPPDQVIDEILPELISIKLNAGANGGLSSVVVNDNDTFSDEKWAASLTKLVEDQLAREGNPEDVKKTEVELDIDYNLKYVYTVKAIEAVSGRVLPDGQVKKLIEKIKFKDNTAAGG